VLIIVQEVSYGFVNLQLKNLASRLLNCGPNWGYMLFFPDWHSSYHGKFFL